MAALREVPSRAEGDAGLMVECTCDWKPPRRESAVARGIRYAIYLDVIEDDTVFDPACPFHGEHGTMVARIKL
jgi:hypothetical protein